MSPNGWQVAIVAHDREGKRLIWIHSRDALAARPLTGTENASSPFWSPDGRFLAFFAGGKLKKIDISGGPAVTLCDAEIGLGGTWSPAGTIVFAPSFQTPLQKVPASGGTPAPVTAIEEGESYHSRPSFLPDGNHFLYTSRDRGGPRFVYVGSVDSLDRKRLMDVEASNSVYSRGHLLFVRETMLMAQPFDTRRLALTGEAFPIAERIQLTAGLVGTFAASENGVLVYQGGAPMGLAQLAWFDRTGKQLSVLGEPGAYNDLRLSLDAKQAAVSLRDQAQNTADIWLVDTARGTRMRLTNDPSEDVSPVWSPDGKTIAFASRRSGKTGIYQRPSNGGGGDELLLASETTVLPGSWSPDGRFLLYMSVRSAVRPDLWVLPLAGSRTPLPFAQENGVTELPGSFSPDGRWIAYFSNKTGRMEVYVAPFPGPGGATLISTSGGGSPRWRRDGKEIFYLDMPTGRLMAAEVKSTDGAFQVGTVRELFSVRPRGARSPYRCDCRRPAFSRCHKCDRAAAIRTTSDDGCRQLDG